MKEIMQKAKDRVKIIIGAGLIAAAFLAGVIISPGGGEAAKEQMVTRDARTQVESSQATLWTCSMHPQVQLPKAGKCPICFMDLIPVVDAAADDLSLEPNQLKMTAAAVNLASIQTSPVVRGVTGVTLRLPGKVAYDETRLFHITAWVPGRITKLFVDYTGASVKSGQPMVRLYSPELYSAQKELISARRLVDKLEPNSQGILASTAKTTQEAARKKLLLLGLNQAQVTQIEIADSASEYTTLSAPISGIVVDKKATEGAYVKTGDRLYTVADLSHVWVTLDAYESDLSWLKVGQNAVFTSPSLPGNSFSGVVAFVNPVLDDRTRTAEIRFEIENRDYSLKPDMFVTGVISASSGAAPAETANHGGTRLPLLIPATAPLLTGERAVVYVRLPDNEEPVFEGRQVVLGPRTGDHYIVRSGLSEGEEVVTNGAFKIDSELQIRAKVSMMNPEARPGSMPHEHGTHSTVAAERIPAGRQESRTPPDKASVVDGAKLDTLYSAYFAVQNALARDDHDAAKRAYDELAEATERNIDSESSDSLGHGEHTGLMDEISTQATTGSKSKDIKAARDVFYHLSVAMISLHDGFGHAGDRHFYLAYCPMARDNQGAYWLQTDKIVNNSYWGAAMLRCGEIKKDLPPHKQDGI